MPKRSTPRQATLRSPRREIQQPRTARSHESNVSSGARGIVLLPPCVTSDGARSGCCDRTDGAPVSTVTRRRPGFRIHSSELTFVTVDQRECDLHSTLPIRRRTRTPTAGRPADVLRQRRAVVLDPDRHELTVASCRAAPRHRGCTRTTSGGRGPTSHDQAAGRHAISRLKRSSSFESCRELGHTLARELRGCAESLVAILASPPATALKNVSSSSQHACAYSVTLQ